MQIGNSGIAALDGRSYLIDDGVRSLPVEQNAATAARQAGRPEQDETGADDADRRIEPHPAEILAAQQREDGQN